MSVLVVGVSHRSAPVSVLERVALDADGIDKLVADVAECEHVSEVAVISTCNRVEVYAEVGRFHGSVEAVSESLASRAGESRQDVAPHLYVHYDEGAVAHLFSVAAGLESMVVGESQILGQVREALRRGQDAGSVSTALNAVFQQALRVGKRAHAETDIDRAGQSLVTVALDQVEGGLDGRRVLVVGAGSMAGLAVATAARRGADSIVVGNRTPARAERLASTAGGVAIPLAGLREEIAAADVMVSCTGATGLVVHTGLVAPRPEGRPLTVVDLALPHDVDPAVAELPGVRLVGLDDLAERLHDDTAVDVDAVRRIVAGEVTAFCDGAPSRRGCADRRGAAQPGDGCRRGRDGAAHRAAARARSRGASRSRADRAPCRRQAAACADRADQGAGQHQRHRLLCRRAGGAVLTRPGGGQCRHPCRDTEGGRMSQQHDGPMGGAGARPLRVGTRASALATAQARQVADRITRTTGVPTELVEVTTKGDVDDSPLVDFGGVGVFVGALREALLSHRVDVVVHSLKDIPTTPADGLRLAAVPERADARDALVARDGLTLGELPAGSRVGTGSPRRAAQLRALGLGLEVVSIRGNIDTRMRLVSAGEVDAVILARAGLARVGRLDAVTETLDPLQMLPAPGQGALAVECRRTVGTVDTEPDQQLAVLLRHALDDPSARTAVGAERSLLATLEAGCSAPVGALAEVALGEQEEEVWLRAVVGSVDGTQLIRRSTTGAVADAVDLGRMLAEEMIAEGAGALVGERVS